MASTDIFGAGDHLGDTWRADLARDLKRATPESQRVMSATTQNDPHKEVVFEPEQENVLTPEHVVWREKQRDGSVLVGFDNGEVWHGKKVLNRATERRDVEEWSLHGHWHESEG